MLVSKIQNVFNIFFNSKKNERIYFDYASASPVDSDTLAKYVEVTKNYFGNASSIHTEGENVKNILDEARKRVAKCIKAKKQDIYFASSTTEANNLFIKGVLLQNFLDKGKDLNIDVENISHVIFSLSDHDAIINPIMDSLCFGTTITNIPPNKNGVLQIESFTESLKPNTKLICFSFVNSETGAVQDVKKIVQKIKKTWEEKFSNTDFPKIFVDATQEVKFFEIDVHNLGVDAMSFGLSKIGGVAGSAVLWVRNGTKIKSIISGGGQEGNLRSGTENFPAIVANSFLFEKVCDRKIQEKNKEYVYGLKNYLVKKLEENFSEDSLKIFGDTKFKYNKFFEHSAPHILLLSLVDMLGEELCLRLDAKNISVSTATACSLLENSGSNFLKSIGERVLAKETIRISLSEKNTREEVDYFVKVLLEIYNKFLKK